MKERLKTIRYLFALLPLILLIVVGVVFGQAIARNSSAAEFTYPAALAEVDQYINSFVTGQYERTGSNDGETGFLVTASALKSRLDSNNDGVYLGEGDDAANAPVLVDVLGDPAHLVPGTSAYFNYLNAADTGNVNAVAAVVQKHRDAGFNTDIVSYCATGHTEGPVVMAYGALGQAGSFGSPAPKSVGLKWGRAGWGTPTTVNYSGAANNVYSTAATPGSHALAGTVPCASPPVPDDPKEMTRCAAAGALASIGTGTLPPLGGTYQPVDIRPTINSSNPTMADGSGAAWAIQDQLKTLFNPSSGTYSNLAELDTSKTQFVTSRTQHTAGMAAMGLRMLGYNATFAKWGLPMWNNTVPNEEYTAPAGYGYTASIDTTPPSITNLQGTGNFGGVSATITWSTEPATTQVVYDSVSHAKAADYVYKTTEDTILHANHSVNLTGLSPNTTYHARVISFDGSANGSTSGDFVFTTGPTVSPTDYVYYFPWYDSTVYGGWGGHDWICISNLGSNPVEADVYIGQTFKEKDTIAAGAYKNVDYVNTIGGMAQVRCAGCQASGDHLTVSDRTVHNGTLNETIAPEHTEGGGATQLGTSYSFPWYDNVNAGFVGDWVMVGNADTTNNATVDVYVGNMSTPVKTISNIPPRSVDPNPVQITPPMANGPVKVVSRNGQMIVVTQRVVYGSSFSEIFGNKIAP